MDGYAVVAEDTFGAGAYDPAVLRCIETVHTGQVPTERVVARRVHRDRDRRAAAGGRGRRRDGRGDRQDAATDDVRVFTPVYPRQHVGRRAADIAIGQTLLSPGDLLNPSRIGALAAIGVTRGRGLRAAAGRDPLDRQRDRRARPAARARADLRHQPVHAVVDHRRARRRAGRATHRRRTAYRRCRRAIAAAATRTCSCFRAAARSASAI